ncbi:hypothetical protein PIB30_034310 [Stylosanthes scabra]|uniref:Uncharacterized protein n=1 Tax=Stylosanthes scabra TaxID=79078 RepID=A0ABU6RCY8_9FABA|nr:hypothetical protein [Stylosanthes scabra]
MLVLQYQCLGIGLLVLQQLSGTNVVLFYSSTIFANAGISSSNAATVGLGTIQGFRLDTKLRVYSSM